MGGPQHEIGSHLSLLKSGAIICRLAEADFHSESESCVGPLRSCVPGTERSTLIRGSGRHEREVLSQAKVLTKGPRSARDTVSPLSHSSKWLSD